MRLEFDWDPVKAASNLTKHRVSFDEAMTVFHDALSVSRLDGGHGEPDERWITLGLSRSERHLVVIHTFLEVSEDVCEIRIISARTATKREIRDYRNNSE